MAQFHPRLDQISHEQQSTVLDAYEVRVEEVEIKSLNCWHS